MRTFHSSLSYRFPEIAEAIDLDLFQSLNDFGIQARGGGARGDLQEVRAGFTMDAGCWLLLLLGTGPVTWGMRVTFTPACKAAATQAQNG